MPADKIAGIEKLLASMLEIQKNQLAASRAQQELDAKRTEALVNVSVKHTQDAVMVLTCALSEFMLASGADVERVATFVELAYPAGDPRNEFRGSLAKAVAEMLRRVARAEPRPLQ